MIDTVFAQDRRVYPLCYPSADVPVPATVQLCLESRLTYSWYFQSDCMDVSPLRLARRVRNEFCLKPRKSREELVQMTQELM